MYAREVGPPIGRPHPDVDVSVRTLPPYVVRPNRAGVHLDGQNMASAPRDDLQLGHQPRHNVIADQERREHAGAARARGAGCRR